MDRISHIPPSYPVSDPDAELNEYRAIIGDASKARGAPEEALWPNDAIESELDEAKQTLGVVDHLVLIGIGGSSLAVEAVAGLIAPRQKRGELILLDTVNPFALQKAREVLGSAPSKSAVIIASKSGSTMETLMNAESLLASLTPELEKRVIVLSDVSSSISKKARERDILAIGVPGNVSGRMSAFTATALVPLALLGYDTSAFLKGAANGREAATKEGSSAVQAALAWNALSLGGITVREIVAADPTFTNLCRWYRQLLSESLGKGGKGFVPDVTTATVDYHSVLQLRLDGPRHTGSSFVYAKHDSSMDEKCTPSNPLFEGGPFIGKSFGEVHEAIRRGVFASYEKHQLPFEEIVLPEINEQSIGAFMAEAMAEVMYLGKLWNQNAFDQPAVEDYKITAKEALQ